MAIPSTTTISQVDELPGEETEFSIGDPRWIMRNNADLYSNRELAVAREYSTNAADAHLEAGVKRPIEVTLPNTLSPYFVVRDFGEGMSKTDLQEVYTKFGDSTKRKIKNANGMLGYGCKSAVAYTNTFTVTSIHQGIKTVAVITRRPDWSIVMKIVAQSESMDPSGTEVRVPVHNPEEFATKAKNFYKFWMPGLVLVNGKEPVHHVGRKIIDGLYASQEYGNSYVVMGNVAYKIENAEALFRGSKMKYFHFVAYVENGDVEFPPSRESLKYTEQTKAALRSIFDNLQASVKATAAKDIENAKTPAEAFSVWIDWRNAVGFGLFEDLTYKGKTLESEFIINGYRRSLSSYGRGADRINKFDVNRVPNTVIVTECFIEPSAHAKNKVIEYVRLMGWNNMAEVVFTSSKADSIISEWIPRDKFVTWDALKAALPKKPKGGPTGPSGRPKGSWDFFEGPVWKAAQPIPSSGDLYYSTVREFNSSRSRPRDLANVMGLKDAIIIRVPQNRLEKFKRDYPKIPRLSDIAKTKVVKDGVSLLSDDAKALLAIDSDTRNWVKKMDVNALDDPEFARIKVLVAKEDALLKPYNDNLALAKSLGLVYHVDEHKIVAKSGYMSVNYPLARLNYYQPLTTDHYIYINAKYKVLADRKKQ